MLNCGFSKQALFNRLPSFRSSRQTKACSPCSRNVDAKLLVVTAAALSLIARRIRERGESILEIWTSSYHRHLWYFDFTGFTGRGGWWRACWVSGRRGRRAGWERRGRRRAWNENILIFGIDLMTLAIERAKQLFDSSAITGTVLPLPGPIVLLLLPSTPASVGVVDTTVEDWSSGTPEVYAHLLTFWFPP